ncbi:MAG: hypothetical protein GF363_02355 [Chitinivibrionales bacterium]|nr:hypothetical protein [Chitinivibrionales bacterium]
MLYTSEHDILEKAPGICSLAVTRIPFIRHWPDHTVPRRVCGEIVESVDMPSTLRGLSGIEPLETEAWYHIGDLLWINGDILPKGSTNSGCYILRGNGGDKEFIRVGK